MNREQQIEKFLLAAHRLALARLRAEPARVDSVRAPSSRWRAPSGATRSDVCLDEWQALLAGPLGKMQRIVRADDEHATVLQRRALFDPHRPGRALAEAARGAFGMNRVQHDHVLRATAASASENETCRPRLRALDAIRYPVTTLIAWARRRAVEANA